MVFENGLVVVDYHSFISCMECGKYCYCSPNNGSSYVEIEATLKYVQDSDDGIQEETEETIGHATLRLFEEDLSMDFLEVADSLGGDTYEAIEKFNKFKDVADWQAILVLDDLEVIESMRGKGSGTLFLAALQDYAFKVLKVDAIILIAANRHVKKGGRNKQSSTNQLFTFYRMAGFDVFKGNYMYQDSASYWKVQYPV